MFWIGLFMIIRLVGITDPPLEIGHNWRQATGLMVARNFLEVDPSIIYPRTDETGTGTGIMGMEFPLLNYLHYLVALIFGYQHWYGRLIVLLVSAVGSWYFYKLLRSYFSDRTALFALLMLLVSVWFPFSRKMMPDVFCISLMMVALWQLSAYLREGKWVRLLGYVLLGSLAILSKIPAGIYFALLIPLFFVTKEKRRWWIASVSTLVPVSTAFWWYFIWNPHLAEESGVWYNAGVAFSNGVADIASNLGEVLERFYFSSFHSYVLFAVVLIGLFFVVRNRSKKHWVALVSVGLVYLIYMFKSGFYFYHHSYYIIPFVPVMALIGGYGVAQLKWKNLGVILLAIGMIEGVANQQHDFFLKDSERYKMRLEEIANDHIPEGELVAINGNGNPQQLYLSHRKGWVIEDDWLKNDNYLQDLSQAGCDWLLLNKTTGPFIPKDRDPVYEDEEFVLFELNQ